MQYTILALATVASYASAQTLTDTPVSISSAASASASAIGAVVPVGGACTLGSTQCALGSQCYATNSMLQPRCGNFQAACTSDQQCAFNTCNLQQGLCNGVLSTSLVSPPMTVTATATGSPVSPPSSTVTAPAGSLPLGAVCDALANPSQCAAGVQCWASNAGLIARCGNFNAACSSNAQCAFNTCNNSICSGLLPSGTGNATLTMQTTRDATSTTGFAQFTGAASVTNRASGFIAIVLGSIAWAL